MWVCVSVSGIIYYLCVVHCSVSFIASVHKLYYSMMCIRVVVCACILNYLYVCVYFSISVYSSVVHLV